MKWLLSIIIGSVVVAFSAAGAPLPGIALAVIIGIIWGAFASAKSRASVDAANQPQAPKGRRSPSEMPLE